MSDKLEETACVAGIGYVRDYLEAGARIGVGEVRRNIHCWDCEFGDCHFECCYQDAGIVRGSYQSQCRCRNWKEVFLIFSDTVFILYSGKQPLARSMQYNIRPHRSVLTIDRHFLDKAGQSYSQVLCYDGHLRQKHVIL